MRQFDVGCFLRASFLETLCSEVPSDMYQLAASVPELDARPDTSPRSDASKNRENRDSHRSATLFKI